MKTIYLIRHSGPFVKLQNFDNEPFAEISKNMILSVEAEEKSKDLCNIAELNNLDEIYSSASARSIATSKYIAKSNNLEVKIDKRINERVFGITYLNELPNDFIAKQFLDKNYKLANGESLNEVIERFTSFINEILSSNNQKTALFIHGIALMAYLSSICEVIFYNDKFKVQFNNKIIIDRMLKNPDIYKLDFNEDNQVINITTL